MNVIQSFGLAFEALRERRLRAILTILMVVMGASLIVSLDGVGNGFTNYVNSQFKLLGTNILIVQPRSSNFKMDKALADTISKFDGIREVVPYIQQISPASAGGQDQTVVVMGVDQSKLPLLFPTMSLQLGDYVASSDSVGAVLGSEVARLYDSRGPFANIGQSVRIRYTRYEENKPMVSQRAFNVRGILNSVGSSIVPVDQMVFVSLSAANTFFDRGNVYDGFFVITRGIDQNVFVQRQISGRYGGDVTIVSPQAIADVINNITSSVEIFTTAVASISLLVASVGIVTTLHTSMMERIKEIGLLKALGFNNRLVLTLFLNEAAIIGITGGTIGVIGGIFLSQGMSYFLAESFRIGGVSTGGITGGRSTALLIIPSFNIMKMFSTWLLCVFLSMVSGFYPAWRASRLDPVVALRQE